jgi:hypothetical protein
VRIARALRIVALTWAVAALVMALWLVIQALGLLDHLTDAGCAQQFAMCITRKQQTARGFFAAICSIGAAGAAASIWPISRARRPVIWHLAIPATIAVVVFMAAARPEEHLRDNTQWFSGDATRGMIHAVRERSS